MTEYVAVWVPELLVVVGRVSGLFWYVAVHAWRVRVGESMSFNGSSMESIQSLDCPKTKEGPRTLNLELMDDFFSSALTQEGSYNPYFKPSKS